MIRPNASEQGVREGVGASLSATGLSQVEPQDGLGPSGFDPSRGYFWFTAAPSPRSYRGGHDAGRHAWKRHAVNALAEERFADIRRRRAACNLLAKHGWDDDLFIPETDRWTDYRCKKCRRALGISLLDPNELRVQTMLRDSDGSPKGGDGEAGSVHDSAAPSGDRP